MSKTPNEVVQYFENLYAGKAQYVWGMNGDVINEATIGRAMQANKSAMYDQLYYYNKLTAGANKIGAGVEVFMKAFRTKKPISVIFIKINKPKSKNRNSFYKTNFMGIIN